jgi:hypothetical protein
VLLYFCIFTWLGSFKYKDLSLGCLHHTLGLQLSWVFLCTSRGKGVLWRFYFFCKEFILCSYHRVLDMDNTFGKIRHKALSFGFYHQSCVSYAGFSPQSCHVEAKLYPSLSFYNYFVGNTKSHSQFCVWAIFLSPFHGYFTSRILSKEWEPSC